MILHTCPKCQTPCLYAVSLNERVNCRSCGGGFTLTRSTKTEKDPFIRFAELARLKAKSIRLSRWLVYSAASVAALVVIWIAVSIFGLIPDEFRMMNRRFAAVANENRLKEAVGLVALGINDPEKGPVFGEFFTAVAITNDGYMLTSKQVGDTQFFADVWVFVGGRRLDAKFVWSDKIADFAVIKVDASLALRFRIAAPTSISQLNVPIEAVGHQPLEKEVRSPGDWPLAITHGTVSRVFSDDVGTEWIEHSAPLGEGSRGSPLLFHDQLIGLNVGSKSGISRATSIGPFRDTIWRMIQQWEEANERSLKRGP